MKLKFTVFSGIILIAGCTDACLYAQTELRNIDMELVMSLPEEGQTYPAGPAPIKLEVINHGPDTLFAGDSLIYTSSAPKQYYYVEQDQLSLSVLEEMIVPGERGVILDSEDGITLTPSGTEVEEVQFCMTLLHLPSFQVRSTSGPSPAANIDYGDGTTGNNTACSQFSIAPEGSSNLTDVTLSERIKIYPNPATSTLFLEWKGRNDTKIIVSMYDVLGRPVLRQEYAVTYGTALPIKISHVKDGLYSIEISNNDTVYRTKWLKQ